MVVGIRKVFPWVIRSALTRVSEWGLSFIMLLTGLGLLQMSVTFDYSSRLWPMIQVFPEWVWGILLSVIGGGSLIALFVNGMKPIQTTRIRIYGAIARQTIWMLFAITYIYIGFKLDEFRIPSAIYPVFVLMDWAIIIRATWEHSDVRES